MLPTLFTAIQVLGDLARRRGTKQRAGVTLLELILALSLSVLIMAAIGFAVELHLKTLQSRKTHVEEAQLGRQVLRRMSDDLRSAVQYQVIDFSSVESLAASSAAGLAQSATGVATQQVDPLMSGSLLLDSSGGDTGLGSSLLSGLTEEKEPVSISGSATPPKIPGLYGTQFELQIDISRLPRVDEYQSMINPLSGQTVADIPSDVKTVAYYLQPDLSNTSGVLSDSSQATRVLSTGSAGRGLVRREVDRAVSTWAAENGNVDDLANEGQMLAPEVTGLEFRYFDGTEWLSEWNSDERQGLPVAVEIAVEIGGDASSSADEAQPRSLLSPTAIAEGSAASEQPVGRMLYRMVVHLPAGEATVAGQQRFEEPAFEEATGGATNPTTGAAQNQGQGAAGQGAAGQQGGGAGGQGAFGGGGQGGGGQGGGGRGGRGGQNGGSGGGRGGGQNQGGGGGGMGGGRGGGNRGGGFGGGGGGGGNRGGGFGGGGGGGARGGGFGGGGGGRGGGR